MLALAEIPEQHLAPARRRLAEAEQRVQLVAPDAALALLEIGAVEMGDEADIGLVDAHAEGDGRDHDDALLFEEPVLVALARSGIHAGMVGERGAALGAEP